MKYSFVLTASLCVGLALGFIAPAGVPKILVSNDTVKKTEDDRESIKHSRAEGHHLDEALLHEHATEKENNLYTRSSIFFNQGYVAPIRDTYDVKHHEIRQKNKKYPIQSSLTDLEIAHYGEFPLRFSAGYSSINEDNSKYKVSGHSVINKLNNDVLANSLYSKGLNNKGQSQTNERQVQQHYLKPLNPSLIRPKSYEDDKIPYGYPNKNDLIETQVTKHSKHCDKTESNPHMLLESNIGQKPLNKFRDIARLHLLQKSTYGNNRLISNPEDFAFGGQLDSEVVHMRLNEKHIGEKDLSYKQKDVNTQTASSGEKFVNYKNCNPLDCAISVGKQYNNNQHGCDCSSKRERLSREGLKFNENVVNTDSPRSNDYDEITDETNGTKNDELLNMINKLNETLEIYH